MKKILIFGSTGSVGKNALEVIRKANNNFKVIGLCVNQNINVLYRQIKEFNPRYVCVRDEVAAKSIGKKLNRRIKIFKGEKGLEQFSRLSSDISLMAISGISCLKPLMINLKHTKRVALANKESIVCAGSLVFKEAKKNHTQILPVDSEINALFQLLQIDGKSKVKKQHLEKVILTASGGAVANYSKKALLTVKAKEVLSHPNWKMGSRITVDSATLVNKAFEVIETRYFFDIPYSKIEVVLHGESIIHALIKFSDNNFLASFYKPDMKIPISHALFYPKRFNACTGCLNSKNKDIFAEKNTFCCTFSKVNYRKYPLFKVILNAALKKDNSLTILNACDEVGVDYFLKGKIEFKMIEKVMCYLFKNYPSRKIKTISDVFYWDKWAREKTKKYFEVK